MSLVKCSECHQEVSTEALACPHCGKPILKESVAESVDESWTVGTYISMFVVIIVVSVLIFIIIKQPSSISNLDDLYQIFSPKNSHPSVSTKPRGQQVLLQEVKNLGYDFFVGQIDSAGTNNLTDDFKNQITKIAYNAHFPISLLKNIPIIILNNLALTGNQYISTASGNFKVPDLKPDWLSEGGIYTTFDNGQAFIFINKPIIAQGQLIDVLTHELGHAIGGKLTDQDWAKFYQLRNIPSGTPRQGTSWNLSPSEDFAEVYKNTFTGLEVRTFYGFFSPRIGDSELLGGGCYQEYRQIYDSIVAEYQRTNKPRDCAGTDILENFSCMSNPSAPTESQYAEVKSKADSDSTVQNCRRNLMANPSKWEYGMQPYISTVGPQTKSFINSIVNK